MKVINTSTVLNFELNSYDESYEIYKVLLDFMESMAIGDIF